MRRIVVGVLVFEGCQESGATAALDVFRVLDAIAASGPAADAVAIEAAFVSVEGGVRSTAAGLQIHTRRADADGLDALIAPGIHHRTAAEIGPAVERLGAEARLLAAVAAAGKPVLGSCSAVFLLAASGALDGRRATTSWWLGPALHKAWPQIRVEADDRLVSDGACVTAAGVTSYHDLALWLVRRFAGEDLHRACSKFLLLDRDRQSQTPFVIDSLIETPREDVLARARSWLNARLVEPIRIEDLARHCGVSPRTLLRRFRQTADRTPARYIQSLRLERAKALLEGTALSVAEVVAQCGYRDIATFRKTFKLRIQLTPQQYRDRFRHGT